MANPKPHSLMIEGRTSDQVYTIEFFFRTEGARDDALLLRDDIIKGLVHINTLEQFVDKIKELAKGQVEKICYYDAEGYFHDGPNGEAGVEIFDDAGVSVYRERWKSGVKLCESVVYRYRANQDAYFAEADHQDHPLPPRVRRGMK